MISRFFKKPAVVNSLIVAASITAQAIIQVATKKEDSDKTPKPSIESKSKSLNNTPSSKPSSATPLKI